MPTQSGLDRTKSSPGALFTQEFTRILRALFLESGPRNNTYISYYLTTSNFSAYVLIRAWSQSHCPCYSGKTSLLFPKANPLSLDPTLSSLKALPQLYFLSPLKHRFPFLHWIIPIKHKTCSMLSQLKPTIQDKLSLHFSSLAGQLFPISLHNKSSCTFKSHSLINNILAYIHIYFSLKNNEHLPVPTTQLKKTEHEQEAPAPSKVTSLSLHWGDDHYPEPYVNHSCF